MFNTMKISKCIYLLPLLYVFANCQTNNSTKVTPNMNPQVIASDSTTNATKMLVMEFVAGMGRALQQLLSTASSTNNKQIVDYNSTTIKPENNRIESEKLREEINKRVNQLQTLIGTAIQVSKDRRDVMTKRILEQINGRLDGAKERADKIFREPTNSEIAVKTLRTINTGISNLSTFANSLLNRVNVSINVNLKQNNESMKNP